MSVNKARSHVFVLPEDDADLQLASEFQAQIDPVYQRQMRVLDVAGGWTRVLSLFSEVHVAEMNRCHSRFMVLLIDFDKNDTRLSYVRSLVPEHLADRVFVLGSWSDPEGLKQAGLGTYPEIGAALARDCRDGTDHTWAHALLRHNAGELERLRQSVRPILFSAAQI